MIGQSDLEIMQRITLSKNFTLWELARSDQFDLVEYPLPSGMFGILRLMAEMVLQPTRNVFGKTRVNSGYRNKKINKACKGSKNSDHLDGFAVDFTPLEADLYIVYAWMAEHIPYRQLILYTKKKFIHCSVNHPEKPYLKELKRL